MNQRFTIVTIVTLLFMISLFVLYSVFSTSTKAGPSDLFIPGTEITPSSIFAAMPSAPLTVKNGERIALEARVVEKELNGARLIMYGFNIAPYVTSSANHAIMGRFGNVLLVNGTERYELAV